MVSLKNHSGGRALALTSRDLALLAFIAANRAVPSDLLAARFFASNPQTGQANSKPVRACERRLQLLASDGYVWLTSFHDGDDHRDVAMLGPASCGITGKRPGRVRIPPRKRAHHVRTLDALAQIERSIQKNGGRVVRTRLENDLLVEQLGGRWTQRGDAFDACPDAACTIEIGEGDQRRTFEVAIEYVTSKYASEDIIAKRDSFAGDYDHVFWCADRPRTAARVRKLTGERCTVLT